MRRFLDLLLLAAVALPGALLAAESPAPSPAPPAAEPPVPAAPAKPRRPSEDPNWNTYVEEEKNRRRMDWAEAKMKAQLGADFRIIRHPPFVIGANCSEERIQKIRDRILTRFTAAVMKQFEMKNVRHEIRVYLFKKDSDDYQTYAVKMWNQPAPEGAGAYAITNERALMVPDQGGGMGLAFVQHEIIHILWRYDVKNPARWFDEGFAAFFEHANVDPGEDKVKVGYHARLWEAQAYAKKPEFSLAKMMGDKGLDDYMVYPVGSHLFIWLQDQGLLEKYYRAYREGWEEDQTGRRALERTVGKKIGEIEAVWKAWVLARKNPEGGGDAAPPTPAPGDKAGEGKTGNEARSPKRETDSESAKPEKTRETMPGAKSEIEGPKSHAPEER